MRIIIASKNSRGNSLNYTNTSFHLSPEVITGNTKYSEICIRSKLLFNTYIEKAVCSSITDRNALVFSYNFRFKCISFTNLVQTLGYEVNLTKMI